MSYTEIDLTHLVPQRIDPVPEASAVYIQPQCPECGCNRAAFIEWDESKAITEGYDPLRTAATAFECADCLYQFPAYWFIEGQFDKINTNIVDDEYRPWHPFGNDPWYPSAGPERGKIRGEVV